mmetsp:Transcript_14993/g.34762  ORF Transcript_14993/g.34762 Transcript_14993/m.34762 type:complete len:116 (+) Transcript_14993:780-1127(+)
MKGENEYLIVKICIFGWICLITKRSIPIISFLEVCISNGYRCFVVSSRTIFQRKCRHALQCLHSRHNTVSKVLGKGFHIDAGIAGSYALRAEHKFESVDCVTVKQHAFSSGYFQK